jgi:tetratricopeptide (TPR) repeat protein
MARAASREAISHFANAIDCSKRLRDVSGGAERMTRLHVAMANALMQAEGYRSERLGQALDDARRAAADTGLVELQVKRRFRRRRSFMPPAAIATIWRSPMSNWKITPSCCPAYVSGLSANKGTAHFNRGEWRFAIEALRKALDLIDRTDARHRILLGGGDQLMRPRIYFPDHWLRGPHWRGVETTERFVQTIDRIEEPYDFAWALSVKCHLCALLGQNDVLLQDAAKIIEISERHGYPARQANGLSWRGIARARLGKLNGGID